MKALLFFSPPSAGGVSAGGGRGARRDGVLRHGRQGLHHGAARPRRLRPDPVPAAQPREQPHHGRQGNRRPDAHRSQTGELLPGSLQNCSGGSDILLTGVNRAEFETKSSNCWLRMTLSFYHAKFELKISKFDRVSAVFVLDSFEHLGRLS